MEGGKDDEKNMRPMFPRLHVSDTEKGGPRAPPRNKMALYEQLSVPSQRFNSGTASSLPAARNNAAPLVPVASLSKEGGHERTAFPPFQIPPSTPADSNDTIHSHHSDVLNARSKTQRSEPKRTKLTKYKTSNASVHLSSTAECGVFPLSHLKNVSPGAGNDNDFSVPTFVNAGTTSNKDHHNVDKERLTPLSPIHPSRSTETSGNSIQKAASATCNSSAHLHGARDKHLKRTNTTDLWSRQHVRHQNEENLLESVTSKGHAERTASHPYSRETIAEPSKRTYATPSQEHGSTPFDDMEGLHDNETNGHLEQKHKAGFLAKSVPHSDGMLVESIAPTGKGNVLQGRSESCSRASLGNNRGSCNEYCEDQIHGGATDVDRNDDASETSMVDSISGFDISPDDVVGVIGQKHFWKARRAIVNQQRLFSVQVFELHRLIKVQKLIAGSPHLLLEDTAYLTKPPLKTPPAKKLSVEYLLKSPPQTVKQQAESQKPSQSTECAAENVVAKPPPQPSVSGGVNREHVNQQSNHEQQHVNQTPAPVTGGNKTGWSFHPPPGNQWLVPVMSASEGLVYKPYTGSCPPSAGFMAPIYGGCGPLSVPSMGGEYPSPYGIPSPHHQGMGLHSNAPPFTQPYFSPYGMQMMNPVISASSFEHGNPFAGGQSRERKEQVSTGEVNFNVHSRTSRNISNQKSEAISSKFPKFQTFKESDIQGSTASSPGEKAHKERASNVSEGRNPLSLFPMASPAQGPDELADIQKSDQQRARVIKVVPHNPRSATESAARIFQSIQEERQQYD